MLELPIEQLVVGDSREFLDQFLANHKLAVLATLDKHDHNQPEAAVLEYSHLETLELIFDTYQMFRKYGNLLAHPRVALVIGWEGEQTLQYEGIAQELVDPELFKCRAVHLDKFPDAVKFEEYAGMKYFKIAPTWIRYTNLSQFPWKRLEMNFPAGLLDI